jgi:hypothetical protein
LIRVQLISCFLNYSSLLNRMYVLRSSHDNVTSFSISIGSKGSCDFFLRFTIGNSDFYKCIRDGSVVTKLQNFLSNFNAKFLTEIFYFVEVWL